MYNSVEAAWQDFIIENNIATKKEVALVTGINGWKEETMTDIVFYRTGLRSYEQCVSEGYEPSEKLDYYYGLNEEDDEEDDE